MSGFAMKTAGCSLTGMPRDEVVRQIRNDYSFLRIRACSHVRFWQILLQKSAMTGAWRLRGLLELAACHPLPDKGMV